MTLPRYRLYREHKYVSIQVSDLEKFIAKVNFTNPKQVAALKTRFDGIIELMQGHAEHEEQAIHPLLKAKGSKVIDAIEAEHKNHELLFADLNICLTEIKKTKDIEHLKSMGYQFYLAYRHFVALNLSHINEEENTVMPELHRLYTDKELKEAIDYKTYAIMTSEQMVDMMLVLFPHMNLEDKEAFLRDIQESEPKKFIAAWQGIAPTIDIEDRNELITKLNIQAIKSNA